MGWYLFEAAINLYQGFLLIFFMRKVLHYANPSLWTDLISIIITGALLSIHQFTDSTIPDTLIFLIPLTHALVLSKEKWYLCVLWTLVLGIVAIGTTELVGNVLSAAWSVSWDALLENTTKRLVFVVGTNISMTIVIVLIGSIRRTRSATAVRTVMVFLAILLVELCINEGVYYLQTQKPESQEAYVWISACTLVCVGLVILLYEMTNAMAEKQRQAELAKQVSDLSQAYHDELRLTYQKMLADQHDLRHRLDLIEQLLENSNGQDRREIMEIVKGAALPDLMMTGCTAVDAVLTAKKSAMQHAGIEFSFSGIPLQMLPMEEADFCVLLSNLLDNAIEGVMRLNAASQSRTIRLTISRTWDMLSIVCRNDMNPATIKQDGGCWVSSKPDSTVHGFGTRSIRRIVEAADGFVEFKAAKDQFIVRILIPEKKE
ncbi:MAG: sensor histidine kinase [Clostridia bacterium]|nr:sensor histidine kinase [Clostridia bacterium]